MLFWGRKQWFLPHRRRNNLRFNGLRKHKIWCLYDNNLTFDDFCAILANLKSQFLAGSRCVACTWRTPVAQLFLLHFSLHVSGLYAVAKTDGGVDLVDGRPADCRSVCMGGCRDGYVLMSASLRRHVFFFFCINKYSLGIVGGIGKLN